MSYRVLVGNEVYDIEAETLLNYIAPKSDNSKLYLQIGHLSDDIKEFLNSDDPEKQKLLTGISKNEESTSNFNTVFQKLKDAGIIQQIGNKSQYWIKDENGNFRLNSSGEYARYNMGDIFENIDRLFSIDAFKNGNELTVFAKSFRHDSSYGTTSGDYTIIKNQKEQFIEAKARKASLMSAKQLENQFNIISKLAYSNYGNADITQAYNNFFINENLYISSIYDLGPALGNVISPLMSSWF